MRLYPHSNCFLSPTEPSKPQVKNARAGSALLLTLLVVSLLLMIVLGFVVFVRMELRQVSNYQLQANARANARLGMELAVARLQEIVGADTRVTATAAIRDSDPGTLTPDDVEHPYWTGVWRKQDPDTRTHNPEFLGWLTSLSPGKDELLESSEQTLDPTQKISLVGEGSVLSSDEYVWAEKVDIPVAGSTSDIEGRYAYLVLDQGVKASLGLQDPDQGGTDLSGYASQMFAQRQAGETLSGFSAVGSVDPVLVESADLVSRLHSWDSLGLVDQNFVDGSREEFHHATLMTLGVQSDTAKGGLKTDLTLAFEKSDTEFHQLTSFTDSGEENQSGSWSQGFDLGYVYALESRSASNTRPNSETNPEAADWSSSNLKVRGPTWDLLRNYYLMYHDRASLGATSGLTARAPSPDRFDGVSRNESVVTTYSASNQADVRNRNTFSGAYIMGQVGQSGNVIRVTDSALAPVVIRVLYTFSLARENGSLALVMNNILVLHNPYDVPVEFRGYKFAPGALPISALRIKRRPDPSDPSPQYGDMDKEITSTHSWLLQLSNKSNTWAPVLYILTEDGTETPANRMVMQPGEIIAFSNSGTALKYGSETVDQGIGIASGPEYEEDSGLYFDRFGMGGSVGINEPNNTSVQEIGLTDTDRVWVEIELKSTWNNFQFITPDNLDASSDSWNKNHNSDAFLARLTIPVGTLSGGGRTIGSLTGDYYTGLELGSSLDDRVPLFVMDARMKTLTGDAAVLSSYNPRAMISQDRFMNDEAQNWEAELYEINSFTEIDLNLDTVSSRNNAYWGPSIGAGSGLTHLPLFEVPHGPMMSLAGFSQVEVGHYLHDPSYAVGNSFAHPLVDREAVYNYLGSGNTAYSVVDQSYLSNEGLWDKYFFSTLTARDDLGWSFDQTADAFRNGDEPLLNRSYLFNPIREADDAQVAADMEDPERIAAHLLTEGVFNVNSTSVSAWIAVLSGLRQREIEMADGSIENVTGSFFSRLDYPLEGSSDLYNGFVELTDAEIKDLATELVEEVKTRGPFLSLADFVNRRLDDGDTGLLGPLQAAIDRAGLNSHFPNAIPADGTLPYPEHQAIRSGAGAPGYLLQSDILRVIGPRLTARSDIFLVRAYGEAVSGSSAESSTGVWCEAVVQRIPEPVQPRNPLTSGVSSGNYEPLDPEGFGRRFEVLSFRYLKPDEI
ncbi:hypothetical protein P0Y35_09010 [Kiritimatiellaeota bacterium B1221]|nr:hypothetical protein [Kiritimatiellaeota bacterium B1221]